MLQDMGGINDIITIILYRQAPQISVEIHTFLTQIGGSLMSKHLLQMSLDKDFWRDMQNTGFREIETTGKSLHYQKLQPVTFQGVTPRTLGVPANTCIGMLRPEWTVIMAKGAGKLLCAVSNFEDRSAEWP